MNGKRIAMAMITYINSRMRSPKLVLDILPAQITHLKADSNYTIIHTKNGEKMVSGYSLKIFAELFANNDFVRIDRSHLVHISYIKSVDSRSGTTFVRLSNQMELAVPRRKQASLMALLA